jgi:hypothetical protein
MRLQPVFIGLEGAFFGVIDLKSVSVVDPLMFSRSFMLGVRFHP